MATVSLTDRSAGEEEEGYRVHDGEKLDFYEKIRVFSFAFIHGLLLWQGR